MISFRYVKKGSLRKEELEGLYNLCLEEELLHKVVKSDTVQDNIDRKLKVYGKRNKFKLDLNSDFTVDFYKELKEKYDFVIAKDRKGKLLGYICFEFTHLDIDYDITNLIIIKHMYISNAVTRTNLDYLLFWLMENVYDKCAVYGFHLYRPMNEFNGYCQISKPFKLKKELGLKFKYNTNFPMFLDKEIKAQLEKLGYFEVRDLKKWGWLK